MKTDFVSGRDTCGKGQFRSYAQNVWRLAVACGRRPPDGGQACRALPSLDGNGQAREAAAGVIQLPDGVACELDIAYLS
jgi:hypothetical protein